MAQQKFQSERSVWFVVRPPADFAWENFTKLAQWLTKATILFLVWMCSDSLRLVIHDVGCWHWYWCILCVLWKGKHTFQRHLLWHFDSKSLIEFKAKFGHFTFQLKSPTKIKLLLNWNSIDYWPEANVSVSLSFWTSKLKISCFSHYFVGFKMTIGDVLSANKDCT